MSQRFFLKPITATAKKTVATKDSTTNADIELPKMANKM